MNTQTLAWGRRLDALVARYNDYSDDEKTHFAKKLAGAQARHSAEWTESERADVERYLLAQANLQSHKG